jgi:hypothetical protein
MFRMLNIAMACIRRHGNARRRKAFDGRSRLQVEPMEERLALSTVVPRPDISRSAPAWTSSPVLQAESTGGHIVALPERCVHGYKWRPRPLLFNSTANHSSALGPYLEMVHANLDITQVPDDSTSDAVHGYKWHPRGPRVYYPPSVPVIAIADLPGGGGLEHAHDTTAGQSTER